MDIPFTETLVAVLLLIASEEGFEDDGRVARNVFMLHVDSMIFIDCLASHNYLKVKHIRIKSIQISPFTWKI